MFILVKVGQVELDLITVANKRYTLYGYTTKLTGDFHKLHQPHHSAIYPALETGHETQDFRALFLVKSMPEVLLNISLCFNQSFSPKTETLFIHNLGKND